MTKKEKCARIRSKLAKDMEDVHIQEIKELKISEIDAKRKGHFILEKVETNTESITVAQWLLQVILRKKNNKTKQSKTKQTKNKQKNPPTPPRSKTMQGISGNYNFLYRG